MASLQEVSAAELAEVDGGLIPLLVLGFGLMAVSYGCMKYVQSKEPKGITNFELLGIKPPA